MNYESVLESLNASGRPSEPLVPVRPADGVATGSRAFDAREQSLEAVFKEIRGYQ